MTARYDSVTINAVLKPSCVISTAAANYIARNFNITRENRWNSAQLSAKAISIRQDLTASGLCTYFNDVECTRMLVKWVEFRLSELMIDDTIDLSAYREPKRERKTVVRFNPNPKVRKSEETQK